LRCSIKYSKESGKFWYDDAPAEILVYRIPESGKRDFKHDMWNIAAYWRNNGYATNVRPIAVADVISDDNGKPTLRNSIFAMRKNDRKNVILELPELLEWSV
jgi:predicted phosphoadenosine phosphosulfate sulfurtransferase